MWRLRSLRTRTRRIPSGLLRPVRAAAPRPGVGRHRDLRRRPHHDHARQRARLPGLRRRQAARADRRHGDRPRAVLDHRRRILGERPADLARRRPRAGPRPQRQPDQRRRHLQPSQAQGPELPRHHRLRDHRRADLGRLWPLHRRRGRQRDASARRGLLDSGHDQARDRRLPRPLRDPAAFARQAERQLGDRLRELRLRHHRSRAGPRGQPGRDGLAQRARPRVAPGGQVRPHSDVRLRAHLLLPPRYQARRQTPPGGPRQDGRGPVARSRRPKPTW